MLSPGECANFLMGTALGVGWLTMFPPPARRYGFGLVGWLIFFALITPGVWPHA